MKYLKKMKMEQVIDMVLVAVILLLTYKMMGGSMEMKKKRSAKREHLVKNRITEGVLTKVAEREARQAQVKAARGED